MKFLASGPLYFRMQNRKDSKNGGTGIMQGTANLRWCAGVKFLCLEKKRFCGLDMMLKRGMQYPHLGSSECIQTLRRPTVKKSVQLS